jgi:ribosome maturation factor RimP
MSLVSDTVQTDAVLALIEPSLADLGYEVVRIRMHGDGRPVLQIMIARHDGADVVVDDCASASRTVSALLDVADPIAGAYRLEVTSPGLDRPLTRRADFERFRGAEARVETDMLIDGQRRFRGRLLGMVDDQLRLQQDDGERVIPYAAIKKAKLILTDELLAAAAAEQRS